MSSFAGLYTGLSGIQASQTGMDTTSNNVANANTPGYTRQRVELAARPSYQTPVGQIGTGVTVERIARLRDQFLDDRFRVAIGDHGLQAVRSETLASLEELSGEPDQGLSTRIGELWDAAESWANDPADTASRRQVLTELAGIAEGFQTTATAWDQLESDTDARRSTLQDVVNHTLETLDGLNRTIANATPGRIGPELFDQRDLLLDDLAELTGATVRLDASDRATATLGDGIMLLGEAGSARFEVVGDEVTVTQPGGEAADATPVVRGELGGTHRALTQDIPEWRNTLDELATSFAQVINQTNGTDDPVDPGPVLLATTDGASAARTLRLAEGVTPDSLRASLDPDAPIHDNSNARRFADLRNDSSIERDLTDLIVGLAAQVGSARDAANAAQGVASGANLARASEHGVSIDEEMVGLVRYQRALEASARVMTTVDQALETLVNRVGVVGR